MTTNGTGSVPPPRGSDTVCTPGRLGAVRLTVGAPSLAEPTGSTTTVRPGLAAIGKTCEAYGLSVSPNPLTRNPSYEPIVNPDRAMRTNELQYIVWDSYSAARSRFFSDKVLRYAERYHGRVVFSYRIGGETTIIALDRTLTQTRRFPAIDLVASGTLRPELLVGDAGADAIAQARAQALG